MIHDNTKLTEIEKFHYLKSCLSDEVARTIESLSINERNYKITFENLEKRYNNKRLIVQEHVYFILNITPITKAFHTNLQKLLDDLKVNIQALKTLTIPIDQWDAIIVPIITSKLDFVTKKEFESTLNTEIATFDNLLTFLEKKCQLLESLDAMNTMSLNQNNKYTNNKHNVINAQYSNKRTSTFVNTCQ